MLVHTDEKSNPLHKFKRSREREREELVPLLGIKNKITLATEAEVKNVLFIHEMKPEQKKITIFVLNVFERSRND